MQSPAESVHGEGLLSFLECLPALASNGRAGRLFKPRHLSTFQPAPSVSFNVKKIPDSLCLCMRECKYPWVLEGGAGSSGSPDLGVRNQPQALWRSNKCSQHNPQLVILSNFGEDSNIQTLVHAAVVQVVWAGRRSRDLDTSL